MRPRIVEALARRGITRYRLCKDLGLNPGNVYAYLAGDDTKVSKETARRILGYAESGLQNEIMRILGEDIPCNYPR
jgi:predicted transcriptional regulator